MTQESPGNGEQGRDRTGNDGDGPGWSAAALTVLAIVAVSRAGEGCSGYDVKNVAERHLRSFFALSYGQIYPHLSRLEAAELVERRPDDAESGRRGRKLYRATPAGQALLRSWLRADAEIPWYRDEDLAKVLLVGHLDPDLTLDRIRQRREHLESELQSIRDVPNDGGLGPAADPVRRLLVDIVVDRGVSSHSAQIDWCHRAERALRRVAAGAVRQV